MRDSEGRVFSSVAKAAEHYGVSDASLFKSIKRGYKVKGSVTLEFVDAATAQPPREIIGGRQVVDSEGNVFPSIVRAAAFYGVSDTARTKAIKKGYKVKGRATLRYTS